MNAIKILILGNFTHSQIHFPIVFNVLYPIYHVIFLVRTMWLMFGIICLNIIIHVSNNIISTYNLYLIPSFWKHSKKINEWILYTNALFWISSQIEYEKNTKWSMNTGMYTGGQDFDHVYVKKTHWNCNLSWENTKYIFYYTEFNTDCSETNENSMTDFSISHTQHTHF